MKLAKGMHQKPNLGVNQLTEDDLSDIGCAVPIILFFIVGAIMGAIGTWKDPSKWPVVAVSLLVAAGFTTMVLAPLFSRQGLVRTVGLIIMILGAGPVISYSDLTIDDQVRVVNFVSGMVRKLGFAAVPAATALVATVGYSLYILKQKHLRIYAYFEIGFAFVSTNVAVARARERLDLAGTTAVIASVYFLVRGLENRRAAQSADTQRM